MLNRRSKLNWVPLFPRRSWILVALLIAQFSGCTRASRVSRKLLPLQHAPRLVLISIDGMRPDFYTNARYRLAAPTLARLSDEGLKAPHGVQPVFPSLTYPNHTSMVTGAFPAEHGISSNQAYSLSLGPLDDWNWYASAIRVPTLWQKAQEAGLKVALIRWPVSAGAQVIWDIPEIFGTGGFNAERDWKILLRNVDPDLMRGVLAQGPVKTIRVFSDLDQISTQAFEYLVKNHDPDVILIHLVDLDFEQHQYGTEDPEIVRSAHGIDGELQRIFALIDRNRTTVIVTGDHGFATYNTAIYVNPLIRAADLGSSVVAQADGGQAAIFQKPGGTQATSDSCRRLVDALRRSGISSVRVITKNALVALHAYPNALCALESEIGSVFREGPARQIVEKTQRPRGHHGYSIGLPQMRAGFFIWGRGVMHAGFIPLAPGQDIRMPDIAPTAASILDIPWRTPGGRVIEF